MSLNLNQDTGGFKGREFICSCGKNYLSYAALFTHIKQKHDGKAPGPIVRPRSQRKRGRPRKNPQAQNDHSSPESDKPQNGIFKSSDINNTSQKKEDQQKTKKAAQLLGCGGFVAFTAYKPEPLRPSPKKMSDSAKKNFQKRASIDVIQRKSSLLSFPDREGHYSMNSKLELFEEKTAANQALVQNISTLNNCQLLKIFHNSCEPSQKLAIEPYQLQIFEQLSITPQLPHQSLSPNQSTPLNNSIHHLLQSLKSTLSSTSPTFYDQTVLFIGFLLQFLLQQLQDNVDKLQSKEIGDFVGFFSKFVFQYLGGKIVRYGLEGLGLFRDLGPFRFVLFLENWLVVRKKQAECLESDIYLQYQPKINEQFKMDSSPSDQPQPQPHHQFHPNTIIQHNTTTTNPQNNPQQQIKQQQQLKYQQRQQQEEQRVELKQGKVQEEEMDEGLQVQQNDVEFGVVGKEGQLELE